MAKAQKPLSFTFVNPNAAKEFETQFRRILIDKLLSDISATKQAGW